MEVSNFPLGLMPTKYVEGAAAMQPMVGWGERIRGEWSRN
jgi:hypothetical protein